MSRLACPCGATTRLATVGVILYAISFIPSDVRWRLAADVIALAVMAPHWVKVCREEREARKAWEHHIAGVRVALTAAAIDLASPKVAR